MDEINIKNAKGKGTKDVPGQTNRDYEKEDSEELKKLGRQVEV